MSHFMSSRRLRLLNPITTVRWTKFIVIAAVFFTYSLSPLSAFGASDVSIQTLHDLLKEAQKSFETVAQGNARVSAAEATTRQAWAMLMPQINLGASYTRLDRPPGPVSQFNLPGRPEARLVLRQPIFQRGQEYYRLAQAGLNVEAAQQLKRVQVVYKLRRMQLQPMTWQSILAVSSTLSLTVYLSRVRVTAW